MQDYQSYFVATGLMIVGLIVAVLTAAYRFFYAKTDVSWWILCVASAITVFTYLYRRGWEKEHKR